jgi:hypothetical protein
MYRPRQVVIAAPKKGGATGAMALLKGEPEGFAFDFTTPRGTAAVKSASNPALNQYNVPADTFLIQSASVQGKLYKQNDGVLRTTCAHNHALQSQTMDHANWTKNKCTISQDATTAPDGSLTADKIVEDNTTGDHYISNSSSASVVNGLFCTISIYAKAAERTRCKVYISVFSNLAFYIDLSNGTIDNQVNGTAPTTSVESVGNGWYRIIATDIPTAATVANVVWYTVSTGTTTSYLGDNASGIYVWGFQVNRGPLVRTYVPTTTANLIGPSMEFDSGSYALKTETSKSGFLTYEQNLAGANWTNSNTTETTEATTAPDGTTTADKLVEASDTAQVHSITQTSASVTSGTYYVFAVWLKAAGRTWARLAGATTRFADNFHADFNLSTGVVGTVGAGATGSGIEAYADGWYRCWIRAVCDSTGTNDFTISIGEGDTDITYNGNGTDGIYVWGAQIENYNSAAGVPCSFVGTDSTTVGRSGEQVTKALSGNLPFSSTAGTCWIEWASNGGPVSVVLFSFHDGTSNEIQQIYRAAVDQYTVNISDGGASQHNVNNTSITDHVYHKFAWGWELNNMAYCFDGGAITTDTSVTLPTVTNFTFGSQTSSACGDFRIRRFAYFPRRLTNDEIQKLSLR